MEVSSQSHDESHPRIFNLTTDCCDEIFDYLSLKDLHAFGQTCRAIQKVAGEYFKRNYSAATNYSGNDGIYTAYSDDKGVINQNILTSGFNRYITYISHYYDELRPLQYIQSHSNECESINHIYLVCVIINEARVNSLLNVLPKLKTLQIRNSSVEGHLYDVLLMHCALERLFVQDSDLGIFRLLDGGWAARIENHWLRQEYPTLKYLELIPKYTIKIDEFNEFFDRNPNVRTFSTSSLCLWKNRKELLKSNANLDLLEVKEVNETEMFDDDENDDELTITAFCKLLNQLHARHFYKRLNFYIKNFNEETSGYLTSLGHCIEKLCIKNFTRSYSLPQLINLKELSIHDGANATDMETIASSLTKLQRLHINNASIDDIRPFIRQSTKLRQIKMIPKNDTQFDGDILQLLKLNREREKLTEARKIIIYVPDNIYLKTKWTVNCGDTNLNLIEMKRCNSIEWDDHY